MINKRIFGSSIPINVQKKLEARQLAAVGDKKPFDEINSNYKDDRPSNYKYNELIASNFNMEADLSSRTPFARMWTGVSMVDERDFQIASDATINPSDTSLSAEQQKQKKDNLDKINSTLQLIKFKELARQVYIVGTNNLSTLEGGNNAHGSVQNTDTNVYKAVFPPEHGVIGDNNKFLKPEAGITSVSSETEGIGGSIKKTTVNFTVHNFHDYDNIFSRYFLRPGAQIFVDFGWDVLKDSEGNQVKLYDPRELLSINTKGEQKGNDIGVEGKLYGVKGQERQGVQVEEDGFITKCNGDVETLVGIVTEYDSKLNTNGSFDCSVTITSKNSALMLYPKYSGENVTNTNAKFEFDLDNLIFYEQAYALGGDQDRARLEQGVEKLAKATNKSEDRAGFNTFLDRVKFDTFGSKTFVPTAMAQLSGVFVVGDEDPTDSYINWGYLEDRIFCKYFGHGDDASTIPEDNEGKFTVKLDSSDAFTSFENGFLLKQTEIDDAPNMLVPFFWDFTYNTNKNLEKAGFTYGQRVEEFSRTQHDDFKKYGNQETFNSEIEKVRTSVQDFINTATKNKVFDKPGIITKWDKKQKRVPIRETWINIDIVKKAFKNEDNMTFRDVIDELLEAINKESYGLWDWKLIGEENILKINDMNYSETAVGTKDERKSEFDKIFKFNIMSKDSIVKNYNVSFEMPDGDIGSMYAIQAMTGTPAKMNPISKVIESQSVLQSIINKHGNTDQSENFGLQKLGFRYLPDLGAYNALNMASEEFDMQQKVKYYKEIGAVIKSKPGSGKRYDSGVGVENPSIVWDQPSKAKKKKTSMFGDDKPTHNTDANMEVAEQVLKEQGAQLFDTIDDYYNHKITGEFIVEDHYKAIPLPMKLELTIYGIGSLKPGDIFRVDYLPQVYMQYVYFQVLQVSHEIGSDGWYTSLETQFRISPHRYEDSNMLTAPADGGDEEKENLKDLLREKGVDEAASELILNKVTLKENQQKAKQKEVYLKPSRLKGGDLLSETIDDSKAYMWDDEATGFSTRVGLLTRLPSDIPGGKTNSSWFINRKHSGGLKFYGGTSLDSDHEGIWDYLKANDGVKKKNCAQNYASTKTKTSITINRDFNSLKGYMTKLTKENTDNYEYFDRLFSFTITNTDYLFVPSPLYYWDDEVNRYNGYGHWRCTYYNNGRRFAYLGGVYKRGDRVYLFINSVMPKHWWGTTMKTPSSSTHNPSNMMKYCNLSRYNCAAKDDRWTEYEWSDEGYPNGNPAQY